MRDHFETDGPPASQMAAAHGWKPTKKLDAGVQVSADPDAFMAMLSQVPGGSAGGGGGMFD